MRKQGRWWSSLSSWSAMSYPEAMPLQGARVMNRIPEPIARLAHEEYARIYGANFQTFERLHERGGFGVGEVIALLADALERERAKNESKTATDGPKRMVF